jgi:HSP20 family protein
MRKDLIRKADPAGSLIPFGRFDSVFQEFDGLFGRFHSLLDNCFNANVENLQPKALFPKVNVVDNPTNYDVEIAVAGFNKGDVALEIKDNTLYIDAEKKEDICCDEGNKKYLRREIAYRSFKRAILFPAEVDTSAISAKYENGIIKCRINKIKTEVPPSVKIEITD